MIVVLVALADVGPGVQLEEGLNAAGFVAHWDAPLANGDIDDTTPTVVLLDGDLLGERLPQVAEAWRATPSVPGVIALGVSAIAREQATIARVALLSPGASVREVTAAIHDANKLRLASGMRWPVMRAALDLPPADDVPAHWQPALIAARAIDIDIPRAALRWHVHSYATPTARFDELRAERLLTVPELATAAHVDGTLTVQTLVKKGPLDPLQAARLLWALTSIGAIELTPEIHDLGTLPRRTLDELRGHLRARAVRLERATFYDVLEITPLADYPEVEAAYRAVGQRFAPQVLAQYDLAELAPAVAPMWELVEKARSVLIDLPARGRYHDWLRQKLPELRTSWAIEVAAAKRAAEDFAKGQRSLGDGDVHRALGELASACRYHPGHPEYEANLAWTRYRVQTASGRDRDDAARAERKTVEGLLLGCKPWPRARVALALLCAATGDADSARWHLHVALVADPNLPVAVQLAQRLGMRR